MYEKMKVKRVLSFFLALTLLFTTLNVAPLSVAADTPSAGFNLATDYASLTAGVQTGNAVGAEVTIGPGLVRLDNFTGHDFTLPFTFAAGLGIEAGDYLRIVGTTNSGNHNAGQFVLNASGNHNIQNATNNMPEAFEFDVPLGSSGFGFTFNMWAHAGLPAAPGGLPGFVVEITELIVTPPPPPILFDLDVDYASLSAGVQSGNATGAAVTITPGNIRLDNFTGHDFALPFIFASALDIGAGDYLRIVGTTNSGNHNAGQFVLNASGNHNIQNATNNIPEAFEFDVPLGSSGFGLTFNMWAHAGLPAAPGGLPGFVVEITELIVIGSIFSYEPNLPVGLQGAARGIERDSDEVVVDFQNIVNTHTFTTNEPANASIEVHALQGTGRSYIEVAQSENSAGVFLPISAWGNPEVGDTLGIVGRVSGTQRGDAPVTFVAGAHHIRPGDVTLPLWNAANNLDPAVNANTNPFLITRTLTAGDVLEGNALLVGPNLFDRGDALDFSFSIDDLVVFRGDVTVTHVPATELPPIEPPSDDDCGCDVTACDCADSCIADCTDCCAVVIETTLTAATVTARPGFAEVNVPVVLYNNPGFAALPLRVDFHEDLTLVRIEQDFASNIFPGFTAPEAIIPGQNFAYMNWVQTNNSYADGTLVNFVFSVCIDAEEGLLLPVEISLADRYGAASAMDWNGRAVAISVFDGGVYLPYIPITLGDVSGDGYADLWDATLIARHLASHNLSNLSLEAVPRFDISNGIVTPGSVELGRVRLIDAVMIARYNAGHTGVVLGYYPQ